MVELVVFAALAFTALIVVGVLISVFSVVGWFLWLPFKILGWSAEARRDARSRSRSS